MRFTAGLPDLNVWLAVHYWEEQAAGQVLFCTVTALGLVRLLSQPKLMGTSVKSGAGGLGVPAGVLPPTRRDHGRTRP